MKKRYVIGSAFFIGLFFFMCFFNGCVKLQERLYRLTKEQQKVQVTTSIGGEDIGIPGIGIKSEGDAVFWGYPITDKNGKVTLFYDAGLKRLDIDLEMSYYTKQARFPNSIPLGGQEIYPLDELDMKSNRLVHDERNPTVIFWENSSWFEFFIFLASIFGALGFFLDKFKVFYDKFKVFYNSVTNKKEQPGRRVILNDKGNPYKPLSESTDY